MVDFLMSNILLTVLGCCGFCLLVIYLMFRRVIKNAIEDERRKVKDYRQRVDFERANM